MTRGVRQLADASFKTKCIRLRAHMLRYDYVLLFPLRDTVQKFPLPFDDVVNPLYPDLIQLE